jgi:hypothetical protein
LLEGRLSCRPGDGRRSVISKKCYQKCLLFRHSANAP